MKVIFKGMVADEGIFFRCDYCKCEWIAQDRNDLQVVLEYDLSSHREIPAYEAPCPCCDNKIHLGPDPRFLSEGYTTPWKPVFTRKDWIERFAIGGNYL